MMETPKRIRAKAWIGMSVPGGTWSSDSYKDSEITEYIRADLVEKLKGYAVHQDGCRKLFDHDDDCTCGLTEVLKEME